MATPSLANQWVRRERRMRIRLAIVISVVLGGFIMVMGRGVQLHVRDNRELEWVAEKQYQAVVPVAARRGKIMDSREKELAVSMPASSVYADGRFVGDVAGTVKSLLSLLNLTAESSGDIRTQLAARKRFVWIKRKVDVETVEKSSDRVSGLTLMSSQ